MSAKTCTFIVKRLMASFVSVLLVASLIPVYASAEPADDADAPLTAQVTLPASGTSGTCTWEIDTDGKLIIYPTNNINGWLDDQNMYNVSWRPYAARVTSVEVAPGVFARGDMWNLFRDFTSMRTADISNLDTTEVKKMEAFFENCPSLASVKMDGLDTSSVTSMGSMFGGCSALASVDLSGLDTSAVKDMRSMFSGCTSLRSLDLSNLNTANVTSMYGMFRNCSSLSFLDLSGFETSNVNCMGSMFYGCASLSSLDVSGFDTSNATCMGSMFKGCRSLTSLDLSHFSTVYIKGSYDSHCRDELMSNMFEGCSSLIDLDISGIDTSGVQRLNNMFAGCESLTKLDLSGFDTSSTTSMSNMFFNCSSLESVRVGDTFSFQEDCGLPEESWVSSGTGQTLTLSQIISERSNTADVYTKVAAQPTPLSSLLLSQAKFIYDGADKKPVVTVISGNLVLAEGIDYDISWPADCASAGIKTIGVTGKGKYGGTLTATYEIAASSTSPDSPASTPSDSDNADSQPNNPTPSDPGTSDTTTRPNNPDAADPGVTDSEPVGTQAMYRLYNPNSGEHFYTASTIERDSVIAAGWNDEGIGWTAPTSGIQVYRLYNSFAGEHHYTTSEAERDMLVSVGWTWEEGGWFSDPDESVPLYRAYNPNAFANNHHYTTDRGEFETLLSLGWQDEGVGWHGVN